MHHSPKSIVFVFRRAPYGTIYAQEALDMLMIGAAFNQKVCLAFFDDGIFQLKREQNPQILEMKHYSRTFAALDDFDVAQVYVESESLDTRGLKPSDLIEINDEDDNNMIQVVPTSELAMLLEQQDIVLEV